MADPAITATGDGRWRLQGELGFSTVPALLGHRGVVMQPGVPLSVDLADVSRIDSAGLALMIAWLRESERSGARMTFENIPRQVKSIANVYGLEDILFPAT